jgi:3',5'-cyclic AMP phosphodiesterase CpdA
MTGPNQHPTRRTWLKTFSAAATAALAWPLLTSRRARAAADEAIARLTAVPARPPGTLRIAHITDCHIQPELGGDRGVALALQHLHSLPDKPDLILNTGDCIFDSLYRDQTTVASLWDLWTRTLKDNCSLPIHHSLGNHDNWGWSKERSKTTGAEPLWGKKWALDQLGLAKPYHSFTHGPWKFIMLDSQLHNPDVEGFWEARLDEEQFAWLESELQSSAGKPVLLTSHVPICSPATTLDIGAPSGTKEYPALNPRRVHLDAKRIGQLLLKHPNVKLCLSGHLHQIDRADYRGTTFLTNPAISGSWWKGKHLGAFGEMYTLLDLSPNGSFTPHHIPYGWQPQSPKPRPNSDA